MRTVSATELARNFSVLLDRVEHNHEELVVVRNNHEVARVIPGPSTMTALAAMADLYRTLPDKDGVDWVRDSRGSDIEFADEVTLDKALEGRRKL